MVEFNKVSTESYFIKNLLYSTFLPLLRTVRENDYIIRDRLYIYKCNIIRCKSSGYIPAKNVNMNVDEFPPSLLRKSDDEKVVKVMKILVSTILVSVMINSVGISYQVAKGMITKHMKNSDTI